MLFFVAVCIFKFYKLQSSWSDTQHLLVREKLQTNLPVAKGLELNLIHIRPYLNWSPYI